MRWMLFCLCLLAPAGPAMAQGFILPHPPPPPPRPGPLPRPVPPPRPVMPLQVRAQKVDMRASSGALKVEVEQVFYNPNGFPMEGTYFFPLPEGASVSAFRMLIDREPVEGKLLSVEEARRIYASYVRRNVDPAILEYVGRNAFQARVFPIPPASERRIYLTYTQVLDYTSGLYRLVYPLNSERVTGETAGDLTIHCRIDGKQELKTIYSPSHEIQVRRDGQNRADVSFEGKDVRANRDFLLYYSVSERAFGLNALAHRRAGEDGYVLLMLAPPSQADAGLVLPKDLVVVFDTSGSMAGAKIEQARKAASTIVGALNDGDRFNIYRFSSDVAGFKSGLVPANAATRSEAARFIEGFRAVGGTAIDDALQAALGAFQDAPARRARQYLVFVTDGLPTIGATDPVRILESARKAAPRNLRLFSFGVGSDVNTLLLDRLASENGGAADYVRQGEDLEVRIGDFYSKIAHPVLANLNVTLEGASLTEVHPGKLPDLFAGSQLLVTGRYAAAGKASVVLTGDVNGRPQRHVFALDLPQRELENDFVPRLWAGRKIAFLLEEIRLRGESKELKDEVIRLSKEHGIVTPYTAYLVEEPGLQAPALRAATDFYRSGGGLGGAEGARRPLATGPAGPAGASAQRGVVVELERQRALAREQAGGFRLQTGKEAVESSLRVQQLKKQAQAVQDVETTRLLAGRMFRRTGEQWIEDESQKGSPRTVRIKHGSEAYHQVLGARAEWARLLSLGQQVVFRTGKTTVLVVDKTGQERLTREELDSLTK